MIVCQSFALRSLASFKGYLVRHLPHKWYLSASAEGQTGVKWG